MKIHTNKSQFGWPDDNGIGESLIQQILRGDKTATASPKDLYSEEELKELYDSVQGITTVIDKNEKPRCNIHMLEVFETTFGSPDLKLLSGEGYGHHAESFKESHKKGWSDLVESGKLVLNDNTILIVEIFSLVEE